MSEEETFWGFGYGSNMNVKHIKEKKGVHILEHVPAILKNYKLVFLRGMDLVEPGFGGVIQKDGEEIHGLAYRVDKANMEQMDRYVCLLYLLTHFLLRIVVFIEMKAAVDFTIKLKFLSKPTTEENLLLRFIATRILPKILAFLQEDT